MQKLFTKTPFIVSVESAETPLDCWKEIESDGAKVEREATFAAALRRLRANQADILFCDADLPNLSCPDALRRVKSVRAGLPVIFVGGKVSIETTVAAIRHGAFDFLGKPLKPAKLRKTIERALKEGRYTQTGGVSSDRVLALKEEVRERTEMLEYATRQLTALNVTSNRFTQIFNEAELYDEIPELLTHTLDFDRASFLLVENGDLKLRSFCMEKDPPAVTERFLDRVKKNKFPTPPHFWESYEQNKTIFVPDLNADPRWPREAGHTIRTKAVVIAPIRSNGKPIGIIVGNMQHHERDMDVHDVERFEMFSNMVGLAIDNIHAYQSLERKVVERTESLNQANKELRAKTKELEQKTYSLGRANVELLKAQEELESRNREMRHLFQAVKESNIRLQSILDASQNAIVLVDRQQKITSSNRKVRDFFCQDVSDVMGASFQTFLKKIGPCFVRPKAFADYTRLLQAHPTDPDSYAGPDDAIEQTFELKSGRTRFISIFSAPVHDQAGEEIGRVWMYVDLTKVKRADEQLRAIVEASPMPFIVSRKEDGTILYANDPMADMVGLSRRELIGLRTPDFYFDPSERERVLSLLERDGSLRDYEFKIRKSDGSPAWMIFSLVESEIGGEPVLIGAFYDISARKKAEEAVRESEEKLRQITDNIREAFWMIDLESGEMIYVSPSFEEIFGRPPESLKMTPYQWLDSVHPEDRHLLASDIESSHEHSDEREFRIVRPDRSIRWIRSRAFPIRNGEGRVYRYCGISEDITERKQAEETLQQSLVDLENANRELRETQTQLVQSEKMAALGMLVAGIAHEINTPVGAIYSMHDTLKRAVLKLTKGLEGKYGEVVSDQAIAGALKVIHDASRVIDNGCERVTTIVRRLRSFARLDEAELKTVDIHEGIEDTLTLIHHELKHHITVHRKYGKVPPIDCLPGRLNQVYLNLLINAKQAMPKKGDLTITTAVRRGKVVIEFSDTGNGIPEDKLARIFDPGFTTKGVGVGTGLGLSICYQIIRDHHGEISVKSEIGVGSTFTIVLPMNLAKLMAAERAAKRKSLRAIPSA